MIIAQRVYINIYPIQGMLFGLEWDWQYGWFTLNFGIFKVLVDYNKDEL